MCQVRHFFVKKDFHKFKLLIKKCIENTLVVMKSAGVLMKIYLDLGRESHLKFEKLEMLHGGGCMLTFIQLK